jgi:glutathione S-transferase
VSQPTRSVCMLLDDAGIPYDNVVINLGSRQQKSKEFVTINPAGQVPAIDDDGFILAEGAAILTYLTESRSLNNVYPTDVKQRAKVNYWLHWNHHNTRQSTFKLLRPLFFKQAVTSEGRVSFANAVSILESHLSTSTFLVGNSLTLADYFILPELDQVQWMGAAVFDYTPYPNVLRYLETVKGAIGSYDKYAAPAKSIIDGLAGAGKLKLYGFPVSQPTRSLLMILDEAGIPHEFIPVNLLKGEHKQPEFLAVNPAGQVPALDDNGFSLGESCAVIQYLAETRGLGGLYPEDAKTRGRIHFWLNWNHTNTRASTTKFLRPILHGQTVSDTVGLRLIHPSDSSMTILARPKSRLSLGRMVPALQTWYSSLNSTSYSGCLVPSVSSRILTWLSIWRRLRLMSRLMAPITSRRRLS